MGDLHVGKELALPGAGWAEQRGGKGGHVRSLGACSCLGALLKSPGLSPAGPYRITIEFTAQPLHERAILSVLPSPTALSKGEHGAATLGRPQAASSSVFK